MNGDEALRTALLDLLDAVPDLASKLLVGGGFGLFIRQEFLAARARESGVQTTLIPAHLWPGARSTQDVDVFVGADLIVSRPDFDRLAGGLESIRFMSPEGVRAWKWERGGGSQKAEFDVLAPGADEYDPARVSQKGHRIQPAEPSATGKVLHAHAVPEAIALEEIPCRVPLAGRLSDGQPIVVEVLVPHPFCYLVLKLHAFRDSQKPANERERKRADRKDLGRHHALDLLRIVAMMSRAELEQCLGLSRNHAQRDAVQESRRIRQEFFADDQALGCTRIREHKLFDPRFDLAPFLDVLAEIFGD